eukprot:gene1377-biopygen8172
MPLATTRRTSTVNSKGALAVGTASPRTSPEYLPNTRTFQPAHIHHKYAQHAASAAPAAALCRRRGRAALVAELEQRREPDDRGGGAVRQEHGPDRDAGEAADVVGDPEEYRRLDHAADAQHRRREHQAEEEEIHLLRPRA